MRTTSAAVKLTIFVLLSGLVTGVLAMTITNMRFVDGNRYSAIFTDVAGLLENDDVRVAGVRIGQVEKIELHRGKQARVTFAVNKEGVFRNGIPSTTQIQVRYRNLVGQRYLALSEGAGETNDYLRPGRTIPVTQTSPALDLTVLFNGFRPLFQALDPDDVNNLAFQIVQVLQGEAGTVNSLLTHVASLTNTLANRDRVIGDVITNLNNVLGTIDRRHDEVDRMVTDLRGFVTGLSNDRNAIFEAVAGINSLAGTTSKLLKDGRPVIRRDINELAKLAATLNKPANRKHVDKGLKRTPERLEGLVNISSYGSYFNMYVCSMDARIKLPGDPAYQTPAIINESARCK